MNIKSPCQKPSDDRILEIKAYKKAWYKKHCERIITQKKAYRLLHREEEKVYSKAYYLLHREERAVKDKTYQSLHHEKIKARKKAYRLKHPEKEKAYMKTWYLKHREQKKVSARVYCLARPEKVRIYLKTYFQSQKGKEAIKKTRAKRRQLGFNPLNKWFAGSHGHHIDKEQVIYMPKELHRSIWHNVLQNRNMEEINNMAFKFLEGTARELCFEHPL